MDLLPSASTPEERERRKMEVIDSLVQRLSYSPEQGNNSVSNMIKALLKTGVDVMEPAYTKEGQVIPLPMVGSTNKFANDRRLIEEITAKIREGKPSWAEARLTQHPFGTRHVDRTGVTQEIWKTPHIGNIPYPGRFDESELARVLGDPYGEGTIHGFFTPKGKTVGTAGTNTHREGLDRLLDYRSPNSLDGNSYVNDLFYENPIKNDRVYDTTEMLSDTGLTRVFRANPRVQQPSYMEIPPNITDEQLATVLSKFGKPRDASMAVGIPEEIKTVLREQGPRNVHMRHYIDQMYDTPGQADDQVRSIIGRYAEDLGRYFR